MLSWRFPKWDEDEDDEICKPNIYVMRALILGTSCTPCIAHYVRDFNAEQFRGKCPQVVKVIQHHHYVDDFVGVQQIIILVEQVKWSSNSSEGISHLRKNNLQDQKPKELADIETILSIYWSPNKNSFAYMFRFARLRRKVFTNKVTPAKRAASGANVSFWPAKFNIELHGCVKNSAIRALAMCFFSISDVAYNRISGLIYLVLLFIFGCVEVYK